MNALATNLLIGKASSAVVQKAKEAAKPDKPKKVAQAQPEKSTGEAVLDFLFPRVPTLTGCNSGCGCDPSIQETQEEVKKSENIIVTSKDWETAWENTLSLCPTSAIPGGQYLTSFGTKAKPLIGELAKVLLMKEPKFKQLRYKEPAQDAADINYEQMWAIASIREFINRDLKKQKMTYDDIEYKHWAYCNFSLSRPFAATTPLNIKKQTVINTIDEAQKIKVKMEAEQVQAKPGETVEVSITLTPAALIFGENKEDAIVVPFPLANYTLDLGRGVKLTPLEGEKKMITIDPETGKFTIKARVQVLENALGNCAPSERHLKVTVKDDLGGKFTLPLQEAKEPLLVIGGTGAPRVDEGAEAQRIAKIMKWRGERCESKPYPGTWDTKKKECKCPSGTKLAKRGKLKATCVKKGRRKPLTEKQKAERFCKKKVEPAKSGCLDDVDEGKRLKFLINRYGK